MFKFKITLIVFVLLIFTNTKIFAHKEWVHQHLIKEGYKLLYKEFGNIPELAKVCGFDNYGFENFNYEQNIDEKNIDVYVPLITRAVWLEDTDDILYEYDNWFQTVSGSHFWNADQGDEEQTYIAGIYGNEANNAWRIAREYFGNSVEGSDIRFTPYNFSVDVYGTIFGFPLPIVIGQRKIDEIKALIYDDSENKNIFDFINNGNLKEITGARIKAEQFHYGGIPEFPSFTNINYYEQWIGHYNKNVFGITILGRIAHLLGDMSVPAHVKNDIHPCGFPFNDGDSHELHSGHGLYPDGVEYGWSQWECNDIPTNNVTNANWHTFKVKKDYSYNTARAGGSLIWEAFENYDHTKFLRYLFYSLNQISDVYPSVRLNISTEKEHGDKDTPNPIDGNSPFLELKYSELPNTLMSADYNFNDQSEVLYNLAIRFTATYLYWVAKNLNWLSDEQNLFCQNRSKEMNTFTNIKNHEFLGKYFKNENRGNATQFHTSNIMRVGKLSSVTNIPDGDVIIDPSARLDLSSKAEIHFKPGFHAKRGSDLIASIKNNTCPPNSINQEVVKSSKSSNDLSSNFSKFEQSIFTVFPNPTSNKINCSYNGKQMSK